MLGVSRSQLHRTIKEQTGQSISLYIRQRRLLKAKDLLLTTDLRIAEISDRVGMANAQNFSTYFAEEFGISPTECRKQRAELPLLSTPAELPFLTESAPLPDSLLTTPPLSAVDTLPSRTAISPPEHRWHWRYVGAAAGLLLFLVIGLYGWQQAWFSRPTAQPVRNSLAILPFTNLGGADNSPACEGIMDDVHTSASLIRNLKVISRISSDQYANTRKSIWQIGDELQVDNVLKGSVLKTDDQLQVKIELINTRDDIRIWTKKYSSRYKDIFQLTEQIVRDVATQLRLTISAPASDKLALVRTKNLGAYNLYLQGRHLLKSRNKDDLLASIHRFDQAIVLDSTFADAHAARATAYLITGDFKFMDMEKALTLAEKNALEAIRLDGGNGTAYGVLGNIYRLRNKWKQAILTFQIALKNSPNDAQINFWYAITLRSVGRFDAAIQHDQKAVSLDPLYPAALFGLIGTCANAGRYDLARQAIQSGEALYKDNYMYYNSRAFYFITVQDYQRANREMHISDSLSGSTKGLTTYRLYIRAKLGPKALVEAELKKLAIKPENYVYLAAAYAGLTDKENCLKYLQLAADQNLAPDYLKVTPLYAFLHNDPRFTRILRQYNLIDP